jgi:RNA polymerase sigma factor (sigma-70 family)
VKPVMAAAAASTEAREGELVANAQAGNPEAFEALFRRYRDRIASYVHSSVRDEGRTEDLVQEIFFSAHSSLSTLAHPGAFRSWLYQIARHACLDEARRRSRQDDLIYAWEEFPPPDERIVIHNQGADRVLSRKEELANLTQALDGLPQSQHDALVLRELEGMSYDEIGERMRLSRNAVESVLFRARRGLRGEYVEIQTGRRCRRMQALMAQIAEGMGDLRERRKLIRHMRDCSPCRREAAALGLSGLAVPSDERRGLQRAFSRVAAFLPIPAFFSRRATEAESLSAGTGSSLAAQAQTAVFQLSTVGSDHVVSAMHKAAAVVAAVAVVGGGGVAMHKAGVPLNPIPVIDSIAAKTNPKAKHDDNGSGGDRPPAEAPKPAGGTAPTPAAPATPPAAVVGSPAALAAPATTTAPATAPFLSTGQTPSAAETTKPAAPAAETPPTADETTTGGAGAPAIDTGGDTSTATPPAEPPAEPPVVVQPPASPPADPVPAPDPAPADPSAGPVAVGVGLASGRPTHAG